MICYALEKQISLSTNGSLDQQTQLWDQILRPPHQMQTMIQADII